MLELACHTWGFSDYPLDQAVQTIARMGFNYIDLGSGPHLDVIAASKAADAEADRIRRLFARFHLQITDLYLLLPDLSSPDEGKRQHEVRLFERLVPFAAALGAPGITLSPGLNHAQEDPDPFAVHPADTINDSNLAAPLVEDAESAEGEAAAAGDEPAELPPPPPAPFDYAVMSLQRCVEAIENTNLRLSIEPHLDSVAPTPEKTLRLLEAVPGISITLDWAHFTAQGIISREIEPLLPHVAHVQVRQAARNHLQTTFNEGTIDLKQVLTLLHQHHYRGALSVEYMNTPGWHGMTPLDIVRESGRTRDALRTYRNIMLGG